jgi:hypothetical protein
VPSLAPAHGLQQIHQELFQAFSAFLDLGIRHARDGSTSKTKRQELNVVIVVGRTETIHKRLWEAVLKDLSIQMANDKGRYHSQKRIKLLV